MQVLRLAPASNPANFAQLANEWASPHAAHPAALIAGLVELVVGAAAVAATFAPPLCPLDAPET